MLSIIPSAFENYNYHFGLRHVRYLSPLISFLQKNAMHQSAFFLTAKIEDAMPAIDYADVRLASRFSHFAFFPGFIKKLYDAPSANKDSSLLRSKKFFLEMVAQDIQNKKPDFIFVDVKEHKNFFLNYQVDYIQFFSENEKFKQLMSQYHYVTTLEQKMEYDGDPKILLFQNANPYHIHPENLHHMNIFLSGTGSQRIATIFADGKWLERREKMVTIPISLTQN